MGKKLVGKTIYKFFLVGMVNTVIGSGIMFLLYNMAGCSYWISSAMNYIVGSIVSFFLNKYFTFKNTERSWKQIGKFAINVTVCYVVAYGLAKPLISFLLKGQTPSLQENAAMLVGMCLHTALNYLGQRFFTFA